MKNHASPFRALRWLRSPAALLLLMAVAGALLFSPAPAAQAQTPSTDATLSALRLSHGTLRPVFAAAGTEYRAAVANDVTQITVTPTANEANATVTYLDGSDAALADADDNTGGHQVAAAVGATTFKVKVTAADGNTVKTYTVVVERDSADAYGWTPTRDLNGLNAAGNKKGYGIWSNGTTMWVADFSATKLYAYTLSGGARDSAKDIALDSDNGSARGIWSDGTTIWVADRRDDKLYAYKLSGGTRDTDKEFDLHADNSDLRGIWSDETTMWVVDDDDKLYAYTLSDGTRDATEEFDLHADNGAARDIWSDGTTIWVSDNTEDKLYAYALSDGTRQAGKEFGTLAGTGGFAGTTIAPAGIWSDGTTMWTLEVEILHPFDGKIYSFNMPPAAASDDATLSALGLSAGTLKPPFAADTTIYTGSVANSVASVTVTATKNHADATDPVIKKGATEYANGTVPLDVGDNVITVEVTAEDGVSTQTYTVTVTRAEASAAPRLETLSVANAADGAALTLTPVFAADTMEYNGSPAYPVSLVTVTATAASGTTVAFEDGAGAALTDADGATGFQAALVPGENVIKVKVTKGGASAHYTLTLIRAKAQVLITAALAPAVPEGTALVFRVSRRAAAADTLAVTVSVSEDGAMVDDALETSSTVTIAANQTSADLTVQTDADDDVWEEHSTVTARTEPGDLYVQAQPAMAQIEVRDDDFPAAFTHLSVNTTVAEDAGRLDFHVQVDTFGDTQPHRSVDLTVATRSGTAASPGDFTPVSETFTVRVSDFKQQANGKWRVRIFRDTTIVNDAVHEPDEQFELLLESTPSRPAALLLPSSPSTVTILDDDTPMLLVSNVRQGPAERILTTANAEFAQGFTTGAADDGYTLGSVGLYLPSAPGSATLTVSLRAADGDNPSTTALHTLTNPQTFVIGTNYFAAPADTALAKDTTYFVVVSGSAAFSLGIVPDDEEDSGGAAGWSIADRARAVQSGAWAEHSTDDNLAVSVRGEEFVSNDATLSALTLSHGTLRPGFAADTTEYRAAVANGVARITVTPTVNEANATVTYLDGSDATLADADSDTTGQQVDATVGMTTFKVKVTAADTTTTQTYTVVIERDSTADYGWTPTRDLNGLNAAGNGKGYGIWSDESTMWVADFGEDKLYAYTLSGGARNSAKDIALDSDNGNPVGVWSNGTTVWVADFVDDKLYAYTLSDGTRDTDKEFALDSDNGSPVGIWSDGTIIWVADGSDDKLYAYTLSDGTPDTDKEFALDSNNDEPRGIWSDGTTIWVADGSDDKLYAYGLSGGARQAGKDFGTLAGTGGFGANKGPQGIWSDRTTMWVLEVKAVSPFGGKIYSFNMPPPLASTDATLSALGLSAGTLKPAFAAGTTTYTADVENSVAGVTVTATKNHADATAPVIKLGGTADADGTVALAVGDNVITVEVTAEDGVTTETYTVTVTRAEAAESTGTAGSSITVVIEDIASGKKVTVSWTDGGTCATTSSYNVYLYSAGLDSTLAAGITVTPAAGTSSYSKAKDFTSFLMDEVSVWCGTPASGRLVAKVAGLNEGAVGTYTHSVPAASTDATLSGLALSAGTLRPGFDADTTEYRAAVVNGVAQITVTPTVNAAGSTVAYLDGSDAVLADADSGTDGHQVDAAVGLTTIKVKVTAADTTTTQTYTVVIERDSADDYGWTPTRDLNGLEAAGNTHGFGIWSDGTTIWATDFRDDKLYAYTLDGGARDSARDIALHPNNSSVSGIWSNGTTMWVADPTDDKLYAYTLAGGAPDSAKEFALHSNNVSAKGVWSDGTTIWVADPTLSDLRLYAYTLDGGARDSAKDITLHSNNGAPTGVWSDGTTIWVADSGDDKIYAYTLSGGARDADKDFDTLTGIRWFGVGLTYPLGIWSDGTTMWTLGQRIAPSATSRIYSFNMPPDTTAPAPTIALDTDTTDFRLVISFGEAVTGFEESDILLSEHWSLQAGTLAADTQSTGRYTVVFEADRDIGGLKRDLTATIAAGATNDAASNPSLEGSLEVEDLFAGPAVFVRYSPYITETYQACETPEDGGTEVCEERTREVYAPDADAGDFRVLITFLNSHIEGRPVTGFTIDDIEVSVDGTVDVYAASEMGNEIRQDFEKLRTQSPDADGVLQDRPETYGAHYRVTIHPASSCDSCTIVIGVPAGAATGTNLTENGVEIPNTARPNVGSQPLTVVRTGIVLASAIPHVDAVTVRRDPSVNSYRVGILLSIPLANPDRALFTATNAELEQIGTGHGGLYEFWANPDTDGDVVISVDLSGPGGRDFTYTISGAKKYSPLESSRAAEGGEEEEAAAVEAEIPDDGLRAILERALGKEAGEAVTQDELAYLALLDLRGMDVADLTGLEHAVNLTDLYLDDLSLDLAPLKGLGVNIHVDGQAVRPAPASDDATLSGLELSGAALSPAFDPGTETYAAEVANDAAETTVTPTTNHDGATYAIKLDGVGDDDGTVSLAVGENVVAIEVTAEDGNTVKTYTVTVTRAEPPAPGPSVTLALSPSGAVEPGTAITVTMSFANLEFDSDKATRDYVFRADVKNSDNRDADGCEDRNNGYGLGVERYMWKVDEDPETRRGRVAAGCPAGDYTVRASIASPDNVELAWASASFSVVEPEPEPPPASTDAALSGLTLSGVTLAFDPATTAYTAQVANDVDQTTVTATTNDDGATYVVKLGSVADEDGTVSLSVGENAISIEVTAEDGNTTHTYTVTVTRAAPPLSTDSTLSSLVLSGVNIGAFDPATVAYTASVGNDVTETTVTPSVNHDGANYVVKLDGQVDADGTVELSVGENVVGVVVTAEDGETVRTYTVTVTRAASQLSTDAALRSLTLSGLTLAFDPAVTGYTAQVANDVTETTVTPAVNHDGATYAVQLDGQVDADGTVPLSVGENVVAIVVTAEDGKTTHTYTVTVTRAAPQLSDDATLRSLALSGVTLVFDPATTGYAASVANDVDQTTVTATANHDGATYVVKLDGVADADGTVPLSVGENVITIEVTAEDGETARTYTVTVTRAEPPADDATLGGLELSGVALAFDPATDSYEASVAHDVEQTTVTATPNHDGATYVVKLDGAADADGTVGLAVGENIISVVVTAEDGETARTYTVTVTRAAAAPEPTPEQTKPFIEVHFPGGPALTQGEETGVEIRFHNLELGRNVKHRFWADIVDNSGNAASACEGRGLGQTRNMSHVDENPEVRTAIISAACPAGEHEIRVFIIDSNGGGIARTAVKFRVE